MNMNKTCISLAISFSLFLTGCQSYPKNPSKPSMFNELVEVNKTVPTELEGVRYTIVKYPAKPTKKTVKGSSEKSAVTSK